MFYTPDYMYTAILNTFDVFCKENSTNCGGGIKRDENNCYTTKNYGNDMIKFIESFPTLEF